ncbi:hypothetical protein [Lacticaseibacillus brantae]|uniref:Uncharacterized protein n=1 Tax=Lacticaseibacillus brantae DSM 23927 TaxID=1423727 RepID=A0A0R2AYM9_9LACO|nr:hypothetical protein [Lacticaseibacillus brantae]KRM71877.1 hypothetical protein FC34_GL000853 [Lacticaseibacillus brantae DSM 23927]
MFGKVWRQERQLMKHQLLQLLPFLVCVWLVGLSAVVMMTSDTSSLALQFASIFNRVTLSLAYFPATIMAVLTLLKFRLNDILLLRTRDGQVVQSALIVLLSQVVLFGGWFAGTFMACLLAGEGFSLLLQPEVMLGMGTVLLAGCLLGLIAVLGTIVFGRFLGFWVALTVEFFDFYCNVSFRKSLIFSFVQIRTPMATLSVWMLIASGLVAVMVAVIYFNNRKEY